MYHRFLIYLILIFTVLITVPKLAFPCTVLLSICVVLFIIPLFVKAIESIMIYVYESVTDLFVPEPVYNSIETEEQSSDWRWEIKKKVLTFTNSRQNNKIDLENISDQEKAELVQNSYHLNYSGTAARAGMTTGKKEMIKERLKSISSRN